MTFIYGFWTFILVSLLSEGFKKKQVVYWVLIIWVRIIDNIYKITCTNYW